MSVQETTPEYHHFGPHRNGLPPLAKYFRELWQRREFAVELSRANMRSSDSDTFFGQLWLVLNPILMAGVYFLLVNILTNRGRNDPAYFLHLTTNLFLFTFITTCANLGATSVTTAGKLILNTAFPRLLIPLGAVHTAFFRFLPTLVVTVLLLVVTPGTTWSWGILSAVAFLAFSVVFGIGLAAFFATLQVYFRDTNNFLPFVTRIWMYLSPVLWTVDDITDHALSRWAGLNPAYSMLGGYSDSLIQGRVLDPNLWWIAAAWSVGALLVGGWFFMTREREFAVRIF